MDQLEQENETVEELVQQLLVQGRNTNLDFVVQLDSSCSHW